jgi:hypothetical protein
VATYVFGNDIDEVLSMRRTLNRCSNDTSQYCTTDADCSPGNTCVPLPLSVYYHADDLFNVMGATDGAGNVVERYEYDDYGAPGFLSADGLPLVDANGLPVRSSPYGNPFLFHGMEWDGETGLYQGGGRGGENAYYQDPNTGRHLTRDPIPAGEPANDINDVNKRVLGQNAYTFAADNPWSGGGGGGAGGLLPATRIPRGPGAFPAAYRVKPKVGASHIPKGVNSPNLLGRLGSGGGGGRGWFIDDPDVVLGGPIGTSGKPMRLVMYTSAREAATRAGGAGQLFKPKKKHLYKSQ